ncbi:protein kinase family protein [Listeria booriae]|uniref:non-specific serine/threonine protein kinase n=1 Tax=Listeria booriae TaxID=1552123 RepID=A0A7X0XK03_9LIST|nr:protein kinase family protein [Listeria booriae]MBC1562458.1 protein kinase [Listeria booriae]
MNQNERILGFISLKLREKNVFEIQQKYGLKNYSYLYKNIIDTGLQELFTYYHAMINHLFSHLNNCSKGYGHFHADESRELIQIISEINALRKQLTGTNYEFYIEKYYDKQLTYVNGFLEYSGGTRIPDSFTKIVIAEISPILLFNDVVELSHSDTAAIKLKGEGSYAHVFCYTDPRYSKKYALKRAKSNLSDKEKERFILEYSTLKNLNSPYFIEVYSINKKRLEYTMDFADYSLYDFIKKNTQKLNFSEKKSIALQIIKGFEYLHSKNMLHRDISPHNILIKQYDDVNLVKISDLGLVKVPNSKLTSLNTDIKGAVRDPHLVIEGFNNYSMRHELYAISVCIFFTLSGKINWHNEKEAQLKKFIFKGTNPNHDDRFKTLSELKKALLDMKF